jgi:hypothetical protein
LRIGDECLVSTKGTDDLGCHLPREDEDHTGILRKSSGFGVFAKIFSKNIVIPSKEIPFFGKAHQWFWAILPNSVSLVFFGWPESPNLVIRVTRITE